MAQILDGSKKVLVTVTNVVYKLTPDFAVQSIGLDCEHPGWDVLWPAAYTPAAMRKLSEWDLFILDPSLPRGDFLSVGALFCASQQLCEQLGLHRNPDLELVPVKIRDEEQPFCALYVRRFYEMADIVAVDRCAYEKFSDGTEYPLPSHWSFKPEAIAESMIFQIAGVRSHTFCSHVAGSNSSAFYEQYVQRKLTGIKFHELWRLP